MVEVIDDLEAGVNVAAKFGSDFVTTSTPTQVPIRRKYFTPDACVALARVTFVLSSRCEICFDYFADTNREGYACAQHHFVCWNCLKDFAMSKSIACSVGKGLDKDDSLTCVHSKCVLPYKLQEVAQQHAPTDVYDSLQKLTESVRFDRVLAERLAEQKRVMDIEHNRIMAIQNEDERNAELLCRTIRSDILNLQCPRCHTVFVDFEGCFALTCSKPNCQAGFCAWCLQDCDADAHRHVANCPENSTLSEVFGTIQSFDKHHRDRRLRLVREHLQRETVTVRELVMRKLDKELKNL